MATAGLAPCKVVVAESDDIEFPPVIKLGASGPIVYDLHETLNERLKSPVALTSWTGKPFQMRKPNVEAKVHILVLPNGQEIRVPKEWTPEGVILTTGNQPISKLTLGDEPIHSVGIYGEQTYALVMLYQIQEDLKPTGLIDAVTLNHLEPLIPSRYPVLAKYVRSKLDEDMPSSTIRRLSSVRATVASIHRGGRCLSLRAHSRLASSRRSVIERFAIGTDIPGSGTERSARHVCLPPWPISHRRCCFSWPCPLYFPTTDPMTQRPT